MGEKRDDNLCGLVPTPGREQRMKEGVSRCPLKSDSSMAPSSSLLDPVTPPPLVRNLCYSRGIWRGL